LKELFEVLFADVFMPQNGIAADEILHQPHAVLILQNLNLNAANAAGPLLP